MSDEFPFTGTSTSSTEEDLPLYIGNVDAETINVISMSIPGIDSVINPEPTTGGYDEETDEELLERYLYKVRNPITSGNKNHYEYWATEVDGVGAARCIPLWNGNGTVKLVILKTLEDK